MIDRLCPLQRSIYRLAAISYWEWRRREVRYSLNVVCVCRAFHTGLFVAGSSVVLFVNCTDTRVSNLSFGGFSLLLSVLAGAHKSVISAGGNSELNSTTSFKLMPDFKNYPLTVTKDCSSKNDAEICKIHYHYISDFLHHFLTKIRINF